MATIALDNTLGAVLIGLVVASIINGVTLVQVWYYFNDQNDGWPLKLLVATVVVFDILHQVLITHTVYTYNIVNWGDPAVLVSVVWSNSVAALVNGFIAVLVQSYLTSRVWKFSMYNKFITGAIGLLVLAQFVTNTTSTAFSFKVNTYTQVEKFWHLMVAINVLTVAGDGLISASLCVLLIRSRTGIRRSDAMSKKLMVFAINTGLLTSICAIGSLIFILVTKHTFLYMACYFSLGRLYTNCLLATLNSRRRILRRIGAVGPTIQSISGGIRTDFSTGVVMGSQQQTGISTINDTIQESNVPWEHSVELEESKAVAL